MVNQATCRLPSQVKEPAWLCHQAAATLPNPAPSAATAGSMSRAAPCFAETHI